MALELEDSQPFLNTLEPSHDSATCRASLEVAIENDSAAGVVKLSNYLLAESTLQPIEYVGGRISAEYLPLDLGFHCLSRVLECCGVRNSSSRSSCLA